MNFSRKKFINLLISFYLLSFYGNKSLSKNILFKFAIFKGSLSKNFLNHIPNEYKIFQINNNFEEKNINLKYDLITISDGWLSKLNYRDFSKIDLNQFIQKFDSELLNINEMNQFSNRIVPISYSPWVILFKGDKSLHKDLEDSWGNLLDPKFKNKIIFPKSARVTMSIAEKINVDDSLTRLRSQIKTYDEQNAIDWLISSDASIALLPLNFCYKYFIKERGLLCL